MTIKQKKTITKTTEQELCENLFKSPGVGIFKIDVNGRFICFNKHFCKLSKLSKIKLLRLGWNNFLKAHISKIAYEKWRKSFKSQEALVIEWETKKRKSLYVTTRIMPQKINGKIKYYIGVSLDITHIQTVQKKLEILASYDPLTMLPNRRLFLDTLTYTLARAVRRNEGFALMYIDLDNFKKINDSLGHLAGDIVLKEAARRFKLSSRASDFVARIGGDEFTIILENIKDTSSIQTAADRLTNCFAKAFIVDSYECYVSISIGISTYPQDGKTIETLIKSADKALYLAKAKGRNTYMIFKRRGL